MALSPRESGNFVVEHAKYLHVDDEGIDKLTKQVNFIKIPNKPAKHLCFLYF